MIDGLIGGRFGFGLSAMADQRIRRDRLVLEEPAEGLARNRAVDFLIRRFDVPADFVRIHCDRARLLRSTTWLIIAPFIYGLSAPGWQLWASGPAGSSWCAVKPQK